MRLSRFGAARLAIFADPLPGKSRLAVLLEYFATIPEPRDVPGCDWARHWLG
ncbi:MAG: hypothetical protein HIU82_11025 [Proteobacteria bacterium]|nr:hypothetical protein [Pseudomonadota bacterium]